MANVGGARPGAGRKKGKVSQAKRELMDMAKDHAVTALNVLVKIAKSGEAESARVSAANAILDRGYGKPVQGVEMSGKDGGPLEVREVSAIDRITSRINLIAARSGPTEDSGGSE